MTAKIHPGFVSLERRAASSNFLTGALRALLRVSQRLQAEDLQDFTGEEAWSLPDRGVVQVPAHSHQGLLALGYMEHKLDADVAQRPSTTYLGGCLFAFLRVMPLATAVGRPSLPGEEAQSLVLCFRPGGIVGPHRKDPGAWPSGARPANSRGWVYT